MSRLHVLVWLWVTCCSADRNPPSGFSLFEVMTVENLQPQEHCMCWGSWPVLLVPPAPLCCWIIEVSFRPRPVQVQLVRLK